MAATRSALLEAGRAVFSREGYHRASLDRVAAEAGFTKGAVYASFKTKADLLLAIYEERVAQRTEAMAAASAGVENLEELRRLLLAEWRESLERNRDWALLRIEFWAYAARDPLLRARVRAVQVQVRDAIAGALTDVAQRSDEQLPMPANELATLVMSLGNGLNLDAFLGEPDTDQLYDTGTRQLGATPTEDAR